jgi:hypothetical protein
MTPLTTSTLTTGSNQNISLPLTSFSPNLSQEPAKSLYEDPAPQVEVKPPDLQEHSSPHQAPSASANPENQNSTSAQPILRSILSPRGNTSSRTDRGDKGSLSPTTERRKKVSFKEEKIPPPSQDQQQPIGNTQPVIGQRPIKKIPLSLEKEKFHAISLETPRPEEEQLSKTPRAVGLTPRDDGDREEFVIRNNPRISSNKQKKEINYFPLSAKNQLKVNKLLNRVADVAEKIFDEDKKINEESQRSYSKMNSDTSRKWLKSNKAFSDLLFENLDFVVDRIITTFFNERQEKNKYQELINELIKIFDIKTDKHVTVENQLNGIINQFKVVNNIPKKMAYELLVKEMNTDIKTMNRISVHLQSQTTILEGQLKGLVGDPDYSLYTRTLIQFRKFYELQKEVYNAIFIAKDKWMSEAKDRIEEDLRINPHNKCMKMLALPYDNIDFKKLKSNHDKYRLDTQTLEIKQKRLENAYNQLIAIIDLFKSRYNYLYFLCNKRITNDWTDLLGITGGPHWREFYFGYPNKFGYLDMSIEELTKCSLSGKALIETDSVKQERDKIMEEAKKEVIRKNSDDFSYISDQEEESERSESISSQIDGVLESTTLLVPEDDG